MSRQSRRDLVSAVEEAKHWATAIGISPSGSEAARRAVVAIDRALTLHDAELTDLRSATPPAEGSPRASSLPHTLRVIAGNRDRLCEAARRLIPSVFMGGTELDRERAIVLLMLCEAHARLIRVL